jgi:hypothetical protein
MACLFAGSPARSSSDLGATVGGVVLFPSALAITAGSPPSHSATPLFVVPLSIPTALPLLPLSFRKKYSLGSCSLG